MRIKVVYDSKTGNTKKVADAIFSALPAGTERDILSIQDYRPEDDDGWDLYFIGFWIRRGSASVEILKRLSRLHGCGIALFGTCGILPVDAEGAMGVSDTVSVWISEDSRYLGSFLCRGRMDISVRNCCAARRGTAEDDGRIDQFLLAFDEAMLHPDAADLNAAADFARRTVEKFLKLQVQDPRDNIA